MLPKIILHNSISIDGSLTDFEPNMGLHYQIARSYRPNVHLVGSNTIRKGIELFGDGVPPEKKADFEKQKRDRRLPSWVLVDTKGALEGLLHVCRRFESCRDVMVLVSEKTPKTYLEYLRERHYGFHTVGKDHVDLRAALELLLNDYDARTILTDTGRVLGNLLLSQGLVSEISLLIHPVIVGNRSYNMFSDIRQNLKLILKKKEILEKDFVWLVYGVAKRL